MLILNYTNLFKLVVEQPVLSVLYDAELVVRQPVLSVLYNRRIYDKASRLVEIKNQNVAILA